MYLFGMVIFRFFLNPVTGNSSRMKKNISPILLSGLLIGGVWIASLIWLIRTHHIPEARFDTPISYSSVLPEYTGTLTYGIFYQGERLGNLTYTLLQNGGNVTINWILSTRTSKGGIAPSLRAHGDAEFADNMLQGFDVRISIGAAEFRASGSKENDVLVTKYEGFGLSTKRVIPSDSSTTVSDGFVPGLVSSCPEPGERLVWQSIHPLTMQRVPVVIQRVVNPTRPAPRDGCVLEVTVGTEKSELWIDKDGIVFRQVTSIGWILVLEDKAIEYQEMMNDEGI